MKKALVATFAALTLLTLTTGCIRPPIPPQRPSDAEPIHVHPVPKP